MNQVVCSIVYYEQWIHVVCPILAYFIRIPPKFFASPRP